MVGTFHFENAEGTIILRIRGHIVKFPISIEHDAKPVLSLLATLK